MPAEPRLSRAWNRLTRAIGIDVTEPDPGWPRRYDGLADRIHAALGWRALQLEHVGSTAVPGLAAKPVIDIDLTVADPDREQEPRRARPLRAVKREAASQANAHGEQVMQYNARKERAVREIYHRAFVAAGLLDE